MRDENSDCAARTAAHFENSDYILSTAKNTTKTANALREHLNHSEKSNVLREQWLRAPTIRDLQYIIGRTIVNTLLECQLYCQNTSIKLHHVVCDN